QNQSDKSFLLQIICCKIRIEIISVPMPIHPNRQRAQRWPLSRSLFWPLSFLLLFFMPAPLLAQSAPSETYTLPFDWQGEASVAARDLGNTAPPFEAQVGAGTFQLSYVPVET